MDYRQNGVLDSVDTEKFIKAVLHTNIIPLFYSPTLVLPEIIVFMNDRVRAAARSQMEWIEAA
ncbi:MAG: hypothetical protein JXQ83_15210, partial [Candidatus Glassbacteria bacterium]|nr:hypothetical protein [Candidatus Glassbacteria bacterium]